MERLTLALPPKIMNDARLLAEDRGMRLAKILRQSVALGLVELQGTRRPRETIEDDRRRN